jgi:hypothetical protein
MSVFYYSKSTIQVDPDFNIYEVALPWAVQRALSPSTPAGAATLRQALLTEANTFQWDRIDALLEQQRADAAEAELARAGTAGKGEEDKEGEPAAAAEAVSGRARLMAQEANAASEDANAAGTTAGGGGNSAGAAAQAAQAATPLDSLVTVLGSPGGATLRRVARDLDSTALLLALSSKANRPARRMATQTLATALEAQFVEAGRKVMLQPKRIVASLSSGNRRLSTTANPGTPDATSDVDVAVAAVWPSSEFADQLAAKQRARARSTAWLLLKQHAGQQWRARGRGVLAVSTLAAVALRVGGAAFVRALLSTAGRGTVAAATMAGSMAVALWQWFKPTKGADEGATDSKSVATAST